MNNLLGGVATQAALLAPADAAIGRLGLLGYFAPVWALSDYEATPESSPPPRLVLFMLRGETGG